MLEDFVVTPRFLNQQGINKRWLLAGPFAQGWPSASIARARQAMRLAACEQGTQAGALVAVP